MANVTGADKQKQIARILKLRADGKFDYEIADSLGVSERVVAAEIYQAKKRGVDVPPSPYQRRGAPRPSRRLRS